MQKNYFQQKRKLLHSPVAITLMFLALLYISYSSYGLFGKFKEARKKRAIAEAALIETEARKAQVQADLDKLSTDRGREEVIREKFNVVKEGEGVVVIPGDINDNETSTLVQAQPKEGFFQKLWVKIFK